MEGAIYLNYCGVSTLCRAAFEAQQRYLRLHMEKGAGMFRDYSNWLTPFHDAAARLLQCAGEDITYTNNTAEGINYVANGYPFQPGDQVISYRHEYPANHYPWVLQQRRGVEFVLVGDSACGGRYPDPDLPRGISFDDIARAVTPRTKVVALSHVQFTSGFAVDLVELGEFCRCRGIDLIVDAAQSLGAVPLHPARWGIAALASSGWKWLCGPLGSGLLYTSPALREKLAVTMAGGDMMQQGEDYLNHAWNPYPDGRRFEYSTIPLGEAVGLTAAIEALLAIGVEAIWARLAEWQDLFFKAIDRRFINPVELEARHRSPILSFVTARDPQKTGLALRAKGVFMTGRGGYLRFAPHHWTGKDEVEGALQVLNETARGKGFAAHK